MPHRVAAAAAVVAAVLTLVGCGGTAGKQQSGPPPSATAEQTTPDSARPSEKMLGPGSTNREVHELTGFVSPSGNVGCMIDPAWARCDILDRAWSPPPRPVDCEVDYGQGISLAPGKQPAFVCAGDTAFGADTTLPYGHSISAGVLRCESAQSWITCRDVQTGHGFSISREAYRLF